MDAAPPTGPLVGTKVVEMAGLGAGPFCGMVLADMGADVVRIDRPIGHGGNAASILGRGKRSLTLDLRDGASIGLLLRLVEEADVLLEAFRPGVAERLGFGPDVCLARNQRLVFARATGWGQDGPWSSMAGHDIDYIAVSGVLACIGRAGEAPVPPLNLIGDFGGGGMVLAFGVVCALLESRSSGLGQVVDGSMVDGSALLMTMQHELLATGFWNEERGTNALDGGVPYYDSYQTADGRWLAVGAMEPHFYRQLLIGLGLGEADLPEQSDPAGWPELRRRLAAAIATRTSSEWEEVFAGTDACVAPVLLPGEAWRHPQHQARQTFVEVDGVRQPAPAPRLARTPGSIRGGAPRVGEHGMDVLRDWGLGPADVDLYRTLAASPSEPGDEV